MGAPMSELVISAIAPTLLATSCLLLLLAGASDVATRRVPNWLSASLAAIGIAGHLNAGDLAGGLSCGFTVFVLAALCWRRGWLGGGDVKLLGAAALLFAPYQVPGLILSVALAGGVLAIAYLLARALLRLRPASFHPEARRCASQNRLWRILRIECRRIRRGAPLPYASAIFVGAIFTLLSH